VIAVLDRLADWSEWVPFSDAMDQAPKLPGVYMAREGASGPIVYVGMAGERAGSGRPQGIRGRLRVYGSGKALTSGLGEAVADRAFADPGWLSDRLDEARRGEAMRAIEWGRATFARADLHVCWAITSTRAEAKMLESRVASTLSELWNRQPFKNADLMPDTVTRLDTEGSHESG
jgi:hypothetical protein